MNAFVVELPCTCHAHFDPCPDTTCLPRTAVGCNSCTVGHRGPQQCGETWSASPSRCHSPVFPPYAMLSHASEPCEMRHVGGSDRVFDGNHEIVVDCGDSRVSISGKRLLGYERADKKNEMVKFCINGISNYCLSDVWIYFNLSAFPVSERKCSNFYWLSSPAFTMLLLPINRHF